MSKRRFDAIGVGGAMLAFALGATACGNTEQRTLVGWKRHFGPNVARGESVATDASGDIVIGGSLMGPVDFAAAGVLERSGANRAFVAELDAEGNPVWVFASEGVYPGTHASVGATSVDQGGTVYALGATHFASTVAGSTLPDVGGGFVVKLGPNGMPEWVTQIVDPGGSEPVSDGFSIASDAAGNVVLASECSTTAQIDQVIVGPVQDPSGVLRPWLCLFSLDAQGHARWGRALTCNWNDPPVPRLVLDASGNIYLASRANNYIDLGQGAVPTPGENAAYVAAFDPDGGLKWSRAFGGHVADGGTLALDPSGNLVFLMIAGGDVTIDGTVLGGGTYSRRSVLIWLGRDGTVLRHQSFTGSDLLDTLAVGPRGIVLLGTRNGDVYAPTRVVQCDLRGTRCDSGEFGEAWRLYHDVAWHPDGEFVAAGSFSHQTNGLEDSFAAVGKFRFE